MPSARTRESNASRSPRGPESMWGFLAARTPALQPPMLTSAAEGNFAAPKSCSPPFHPLRPVGPKEMLHPAHAYLKGPGAHAEGAPPHRMLSYLMRCTTTGRAPGTGRDGEFDG